MQNVRLGLQIGYTIEACYLPLALYIYVCATLEIEIQKYKSAAILLKVSIYNVLRTTVYRLAVLIAPKYTISKFTI